MAYRKTILLAPHEDHLLKGLYVKFNIPLCQFKMRPRDARRFLDAWNMRSGRADDWGDVLHYMVTHRKGKKTYGGWPALGNGHQRMADPPPEVLSEREWRILADVYAELLATQQQGSDNLLYDPALKSAMARMFAQRAARTVLSDTLTGLIFGSRKRGEWIHLRPQANEGGDDAWGDINNVA